MYNFIDVTEASGGMVLPSEALQINGSYIEDQISGYRTLSVQGREALSPELETFETGVRDGSTLKSKRYPARIITVKYQLIAGSNEAFREAYNKLGGILDVENAQLIFNDEQDKYFTGTPCGIEAVEPGRNAVVGTFDILCIDPFKYSLYEYEAIAAEGEKCIFVEYGGTYKAHPKLEAVFFEPAEETFLEIEEDQTTGELTAKVESPPGDCGYVAFFNEDEKIIQLGDPTEVDGTNAYSASQGLINQPFYTETSWSTTSKNLWTVNKGHIMASNVTQEGSVHMGEASSAILGKSYTTSASAVNIGNITSGTLPITFHIYAEITKRTEKSANVLLMVAAEGKPSNGASYVLGGATGLIVEFFIGNNINSSIKIKTATGTASGRWYSSSVLRGSKTFTVSNLTEAASKLSNVKFSAYLTDDRHDSLVNKATCSDISIPRYSTTFVTAEATHYLTPNAYGTTASGWHGPSIRRKVGKDASGIEGAQNFTLTYRQKMCIGKATAAQNQVGSFRMNITDSNGKNIAGIWVYKNKAGKAGKLVFYVNGVQENITDIDLHYGNDFFGGAEDSVCTTTVTKTGGTIEFAVGSYKRTFYSKDLVDVLGWHVTFSFEKYGALEKLEYNGLYWAKFVKHNCNTWKDVPNKFSANDVVVADCRNAEITLNGIPAPNLGALGNNWEAFVLKPGLNQIGYAYSEWVTDEYAPTFKVKYREVFL